MLITKDEHTEMTNMEEEETEESCIRLPTHNNMGTSGILDEFDGCSRDVVQPETTTRVVCSGCQRPIYDKYYMWVDQRTWHESCVQCSVCRQKLEESCYIKNYKLYCFQDYKQLQHCRRCSGAISSEQYVQRAGGQTFHAPCFSCDVCRRQLTSGERCLIGNDCHQISCTSCYERTDSEHFAEALGYSSGSNSDVSNNEVFVEPGFNQPRFSSSQRGGHYMGYGKDSIASSSSEGKRSKRPRTILTTAQRRKFKASFEVSQKPCRKVRETLAAETGLTPRVVQVWFQNQRAKMKKLARRQTQGDSISSRGGSRGRRTRTGDSDSDNEVSSPGSYTSMPTPHHSSLYQDTYRSPGSIQTSPTTSLSEQNSYNVANIPHHRDPKDHQGFDEFDMRLPSDGPFMTHQPNSSIASTSQIVEQSRLQINVRPHINDFNNNSQMGNIDGDVAMASPNDEFQPYLTEPRGSGAPFLQHVTENNPLDRLMYMQDNFFQS